MTPAADGFDETDAIANRLGALSVAVADRVAEQVAHATQQRETTAAALSALHHFLEAPTIELLRQVFGLTHSGAVRLVDRLERAGYARRMTGVNGRSSAVALTPAGHLLAEQIATERMRVLTSALSSLSAADRRTLDRLVGKVLVAMRRDVGAMRWICRMCDTDTCGVEDGRCPLAGDRFSIPEAVDAVERHIADRARNE